MNFLNHFFKGLSMGLLIAMPFGAVDMICIRNSLCWGARYGVILGLGIALADAFCGALAGFGISALKVWLAQHQFYMQIFGGLFLAFLGGYQLISHKDFQDGEMTKPHFCSILITGFLLVATNPSTLLSFLGIFAALNWSFQAENGTLAASVIGGIFTGSFIWWLSLSAGAALFRDRFTWTYLKWLNLGIGILFIVLGLLVLFHVFHTDSVH